MIMFETELKTAINDVLQDNTNKFLEELRQLQRKNISFLSQTDWEEFINMKAKQIENRIAHAMQQHFMSAFTDMEVRLTAIENENKKKTTRKSKK